MPLNRLLFLLFLAVLCGAVLYILYGPGEQATRAVSLTPKAYIEQVERDRAAPAGGPGAQTPPSEPP